MLPVSLDCPFLMAHSVFTSVYLSITKTVPEKDMKFKRIELLPVSLDCPFLIDTSCIINKSNYFFTPISVNGMSVLQYNRVGILLALLS